MNAIIVASMLALLAVLPVSAGHTQQQDPESQSIIMHGEDEDPVLGFTQQYDIVMRLVSEDEYVTEVIFKDDVHTGGEGPFKVVEAVAGRVMQ